MYHAHNILALSLLAAMACAPSTVTAATPPVTKKTCKTLLASTCLPTHGDVLYTSVRDVAQESNYYKAVQWIGDAQACRRTSGYCTVTFTKTNTGTTTWKVGVNAEYSAGVKDVSTFKVAATAELSVAKTDADSTATTKSVPAGKTMVSYSWVPRQRYSKIYSGAWVRNEASYRCGALNAYTCYDYNWQNDYLVLRVNYKRALESFQTVDYLTYKNDTLSGLVLEAD